MAKVKLDNIYKVYEGGVRAVNNFTLDIPDKEFVVFVGPSGCGKSTTLRMIAGLEDITQGKLYIDDEVVNDAESKNRDIAMVFQNYALYPHMTVFQNMAFGLKLRHTPKDEIKRRVYQAAEILEISELLTRKPKALSGGQRQRVALGRAIVREPKVFLLDEPLSNLDAKLRVQMRSEITKLHEKLKTTFIYVTHDQTEAMTMGTRIVVMKDGFIQQVDSPVALYNDPANLFVATFLGSPQMNILNVKLDKKGNELVATLFEADKKPELRFSEMKTKQLINNSYIGKEVQFGIRPESIKVDENGSIEGIIDVVEQLGDETIYYCQIPGIKSNLIVKAPFKGRVKTKEKIKLSFDMEQAHLFDKETTNSILGMRPYNNFKVVINENNIVIGKNKLELPEELKNRILPSKFGKKLELVANVDEISLNPIKDSIKLPINIEFSEDKTDYIGAFFKVDGLDEHFVAKFKLDSKLDVKYIYLPVKNMQVFDEDGELIKSREVIYPNVTTGKVYHEDDRLFVDAYGTTLEVENKPEYKDVSGYCEVKIDPECADVVLTKKFVKNSKAPKEKKRQNKKATSPKKETKLSNKMFYIFIGVFFVLFIGLALLSLTISSKLIFIAYGAALLTIIVLIIGSVIINSDRNKLNAKSRRKSVNKVNNLITFTAYDEDKSKNKNFIYGLVSGVNQYATFYVDNNFSVYAMDKFKVHIPKEGIEIKKI